MLQRVESITDILSPDRYASIITHEVTCGFSVGTILLPKYAGTTSQPHKIPSNFILCSILLRSKTQTRLL
jgi:hypothetical protein